MKNSDRNQTATTPAHASSAESFPARDGVPLYDYDFIIVGSGFGGSVSAHRLVEKGYSVAVIEQGRRYRPEDMPKTNWQIGKSIWAPKIGLHGILAVTTFKDVVIFHGAGVGGGSLVYANTHLEPLEGFFKDPLWSHLADWKQELAAFYAEARRMLGTTPAPRLYETDEALKAVLEEEWEGNGFKRHDVGVFFGEPGETVKDPFFGGQGPDRTGCNHCGSCMTGCFVGAKNSLDKNYLFLALQGGARVFSETRVADIRPLGASDGADGYEVFTRATSGLSKGMRRLTARRVVLSAGVLGTLELLFRCREKGSLPRISRALGTYVRTNSESIQGVVARSRKLSEGIAISSGGMTREGTHIEMVRYGELADAMSGIATVHTGGGPQPRQLYFLVAAIRHPVLLLRQLFWPFGWSRRAVVVLAMQALDNSMEFRWRRRWWWPFGRRLTSSWGDRVPPPTFMPDAHRVTQKIADRLGGDALSILPEVLLNTSATAHILGGCPMGENPETAVIDIHNRVFNYQGLYVVDGSMIAANLGVNPSLTITALAERAMHHIDAKAAQKSESK